MMGDDFEDLPRPTLRRIAFPCGLGPRLSDVIDRLPTPYRVRVIIAILIDHGMILEVSDPPSPPFALPPPGENGRGKRKPETLEALARRDAAIADLSADGASAEKVRKRIVRAASLRRPPNTDIEIAAASAFAATGKIPSLRSVQRVVQKKRATK